jgi:hypothetical protein
MKAILNKQILEREGKKMIDKEMLREQADMWQ